MARTSEAVAGPTPLRPVSDLSAEDTCAGRPNLLSLPDAADDEPVENCWNKASVVVETRLGSFLRMRPGKNGRWMPWVLGEIIVHLLLG